MTTRSDHAELRDLLRQLKATDTGFRVFGSKQHRYQLRLTLTTDELDAFELAHGIRLPEDYRRFLNTIGNGGAGPFYGLEPPGTSGRRLPEPFPFVAATEEVPEEEYTGILEFCHHGCAIYSNLVVNGPAYGTIWDGCGGEFHPTGLSFGDWYRRWLERALRVFENERLVSRLRIGMTRDDVLGEVGGDWQARPAPGRSVQYFEATEIPAQLELDEQGVVIKVKPWLFI